jgi:hypothetical protein
MAATPIVRTQAAPGLEAPSTGFPAALAAASPHTLGSARGNVRKAANKASLNGAVCLERAVARQALA